MNSANSEHATHTAQLAALAAEIVQKSGGPTDFDAATWVAQFLDAPSGALGGRCPSEFMDTEDGRAIVFRLVRQMQSGAYA